MWKSARVHWKMELIITRRGVEGSKAGHGARRIGIGARSWNAELRVLHSNTIWMRLVGALATTFLFGGCREKEGFQIEVERSGFNAEWHKWKTSLKGSQVTSNGECG